jgi:hypothetical protein
MSVGEVSKKMSVLLENRIDGGQNNLNIESISKMEQTVKDYDYKRRNAGITNIDLEVARIGLRFDMMLAEHERELCKDVTNENLARKFYKIWRGVKPDKLTSLRKVLKEDMTNICCVEIVKAYETCFEAKQYLHNIHTK